MVNNQTAPEGFNNTDWQLHKGNKDHARFLDKCVEATWLIWEGQQLTGEAFFKQPWLAEQLEVSTRHTQNVLAELLSRGIIEVDRRDQNYYKVKEFFSRPIGEWTKVAAAKIKAALKEFFAKTTSQQSSTQKQSSRPQRESTKAKTPAATAPSPGQQATVQLSEQERVAIETQALEDNARRLAEIETKRQEEEKQMSQELKEDVRQVAEQLAREKHKQAKPSPTTFSGWISDKLREYGIEAPRWFVGQIALQVLDKHRYKFR